MDEILEKAVTLLLNLIQQEEVVSDLLLLEVDWHTHTHPFMPEPAQIRFQNQAWPIILTNSELIMRRTLCQADHGHAILMIRAGANTLLPEDIQARAYKGTALRLGMRHLLYAHTSRDWPAEVDYAEWQATIKNRFDELVRKAGHQGLNYAISRNDLERMLVQAAFGLDMKGKTAAQVVADLVSFQKKVADQPTGLELSLFAGQLREYEIDDADTLTWAAERSGRAEQLVLTGVMLAAERAANYQPNWGNLNSLRAILVNKRGLSDSQAIDAVIQLVTASLQYLHPSTRLRIIQAAEQELKDVLPADAYNEWFPQRLVAECHRVAHKLAIRAPQAVEFVPRLKHHLFASQQATMLEALTEMAALVNRWQAQETSVSSLATVAAWAKWYATQGSRLDLSALRLMRYVQHGEGDKESIERLLQDYWPWRDQLNKSFARLYLASYEAAIHDRDAGVFGTHRIIEWVVRPLRNQQKRVLLLVIDGMSYPDFRELMQQWAIHGKPVYADERFVALSLLPSLTSVSRKGLFLNALPTDPLDDEETYDQKAQTREKDGLAKALAGNSVNFYHKGNLNGGHSLRQDIDFLRFDAIAAVLNTIDDDLTSTTTSVRLYKPDEIGALVTIVQTALQKGWAVILTADHGHTWFRNRTLRHGGTPANGGARFIPVEDEPALPYDSVVTGDPHILQVQAGQKVAFLTATGTYFGHHPRRGYHGGASLEEVVIPCAVLTYEKQAETETAVLPGAAPIRESEITPDKAEGIILKFRHGQVVDLSLPFILSAQETRLLQILAWHGEVTEAELKKAVGTRRIAGPMATLQEKLATAGPQYDYIEYVGASLEGVKYRFRTELLLS
jgi:hypothetical protein